MTDEIAAVSTAAGTGGVAIIRISGTAPEKIAEQMFFTKSGKKVSEFEPYKMYVGEIRAKDFCDNGMCVFFKAPKSFTGENVVELHCHGGVAITRGVLNRAFELGARPATKGEFTKRAFLNGKLSLSSCEGLIDMINSESETQIRSGYYLFREKLKNKIISAQNELTDVLAEIDANIDYPEEGLIDEGGEEIKNKLKITVAKLEELKNSYSSGRLISDGVKVALIGKTNTGKSSLLNALTGEEKAIVTSVAGTTRDVVEGKTLIGGVKFDFYDTAGIRETTDEVEKIGIARSEKLIDGADFLIFVADGSREISLDELELLNKVKEKNHIVVINKSDELISGAGISGDLTVSAKTGENITELKQLILQRTAGKTDLNGEYITEERHYVAICEALDSLERAIKAIDEYPMDLVSCDIKQSWEKLGEITGTTASEDVIEQIFAKFCVGK